MPQTLRKVLGTRVSARAVALHELPLRQIRFLRQFCVSPNEIESGGVFAYDANIGQFTILENRPFPVPNPLIDVHL